MHEHRMPSVSLSFPRGCSGTPQSHPVPHQRHLPPLRKFCLLTVSSQAFPGDSVSKESACSAGDPGSIPGSGKSSGEGNGKPLQYPCLESPMDRGTWWAAVHGVAESGMTERLTHTFVSSQTPLFFCDGLNCAPQVYTLTSGTPRPPNVTAFGDRAFKSQFS